MNFNTLRDELGGQLDSKSLLTQAKACAFEYLDSLESGRVYPDSDALAGLKAFEEPMPEEPSDPQEILETLHRAGSRATVAQSGGRYFGFVNGGNFPVGLAARWLADAWDQNSALYVMSPAAAKLEEVCEKWIVDLMNLPKGTAAGFVGGSSAATLCALAAARDELLSRQGWDVRAHGLFGAPPLKVVLGEQAHASVKKALTILGVGESQLVFAPVDGEGRIIPEKLPALDRNTLLILQAGNVNSGAFDPMEALCGKANAAGAWVHVDGAFGLWAAASKEKYPLIAGFEKADSWAADAHKTLNVNYDCGIVLCKDRAALTRAMAASGSYLAFGKNRDGMCYCMDMSRRTRGPELWATLKFLGKQGVAALVDELCANARYFADRLKENGFEVVNEVAFNQVLVRCAEDEKTRAVLKRIQQGGVAWCGGAAWQGRPVIRLSVSCWRTTKADIDVCVEAFVKARETLP